MYFFDIGWTSKTLKAKYTVMRSDLVLPVNAHIADVNFHYTYTRPNKKYL